MYSVFKCYDQHTLLIVRIDQQITRESPGQEKDGPAGQLDDVVSSDELEDDDQRHQVPHVRICSEQALYFRVLR